MNIKIIELLITLLISSLFGLNPVVTFGTVDFIYLFVKAIEYLYLSSKKDPSDSYQDEDGSSSIRATH